MLADLSLFIMGDVAASTEQDAFGDLDFLGDIYFDFGSVGDFDIFSDALPVVDASPAPWGAAAESMPSQMMGDIERFLMEEGGDVGEGELPLPEDFFADVLFAGSDEGSVKSAVSNGDAATTPEGKAAEGDGKGMGKRDEDLEMDANEAASVVSEKETSGDHSVSEGNAVEGDDKGMEKRDRDLEMELNEAASVVAESEKETSGDHSVSEGNAVEGDDKGMEKRDRDLEMELNEAASVVAESEKETSGDLSEGKSGQDEDFLSKKRRRQMRNRDSAMKSRERKKMYVRDLEMKSRFLESECKRLQHALHCCAGENIALRQCLQKAKALGAPMAKQESAVLFVESLLLGSLFWLMSIVYLFLMPLGLVEVIENPSRVARSQTQVIGMKGLGSEKLDKGLGSEFICMRRKCKALRTKMKICFFHVGMGLG
uniref:Transcription factor HY5-like n=1 Tax=Anthurium amnicola TaxID=1678845 RepID=A0A1D1YRC1_9ARAE